MEIHKIIIFLFAAQPRVSQKLYNPLALQINRGRERQWGAQG